MDLSVFFFIQLYLFLKVKELSWVFSPYSVTDPSLAVCVDAMQRPLCVDRQGKEMQWLLQYQTSKRVIGDFKVK